MKLSPTLSGLLSEVVYKEEEVEMSQEEASLLQEELAQASEQMESDGNDLTIVTKSLSRTFEIVNDMQTAVDTNTTDKYTAGLLLSEFASIYKDTLGTEFTYSKNLSDNPLEVRDTLTAGLQASTSFIDTLKNLIKKIWDSLKAAAKWFWSKVKQFINWIFGKRRKAEKIQESNAAAVSLLTATVKTNEKFAEEVNNAENLTEEAKQDLEVKVEKDISNNFKEDMKSKGFSENLDGLYKEISDAFKNADMSLSTIKLTKTKLTKNINRAANRVMTNLIDKLDKDKNLSNNISAMTAIFSTSRMFNIIEGNSYVSSALTLDNVLGENYKNNSYRISDIYREGDTWKTKIDNIINKEAGMLNNDFRDNAFRIIFSAMFKISDYDKLCGSKIVRYLASYLDGIYSSYNILFKKINEQAAALDKILPNLNSDLSESHMSILEAIDKNDILTKYDYSVTNYFLGEKMTSAVVMPAKIFIDDAGTVNCSWINFLIAGTTKVKNMDLSNIKKELEKEYKSNPGIMSINLSTSGAIYKLAGQDDLVEKSESSNLEKKLIKETDKLQSTYEKMFVEVDKYIKWFSEAPVAAINPKRDTFNNLFTMVQHLNKVTPSLPLDMLKNNQLIVDSILSSIDFKEEVIRAYKEVMAENK